MQDVFENILPDPVLAGTPRPGVLLFGGSFDPPHIGHVELASAARDARAGGAEWWLVFVPAARSPHKAAEPAAGHHRVEMLRLAIEGRARCWIWTEELARAARHGGPNSGPNSGPSYWIDTLAAARSALGTTPMSFVIGADQLVALPRWHRWREILALARPTVLLRRPHESVGSVRRAMDASGHWDGDSADAACASATFFEAATMAVSSTAIRAALGSGRAEIPGLDPAVGAYIRRHGLYGSAPGG